MVYISVTSTQSFQQLQSNMGFPMVWDFFCLLISKTQLSNLHFYKGISQVMLVFLSKFLMEVCKQNPGCWLFLCQIVQTSIFGEVVFNNLLKIALSANFTFLLKWAMQIKDSFNYSHLSRKQDLWPRWPVHWQLWLFTLICAVFTLHFSQSWQWKWVKSFSSFLLCNCIFSFPQSSQTGS